MSLEPHPTLAPPKGPVILVVMDGVGVGAGDEGDAVARANTPTLDWLRSLPSSCTLRAHGRAVGLPTDADMGNSEVGHNALGAGRVFDQGASLVRQAIADGSLYEGPVWMAALASVLESGEPLHFLGLLSDGNVHSHIDHLVAMVRRAASENVAKVRVHVLTDGRDVDARSALRYADQLEAVLEEARAAGLDYRVASGGGRMRITMDRYEADWGMVERGWQAHVRGEGRRFASLREAVETLYAEDPQVDDQWLEAFVIADDEGPVGPIRDGAAVLCFNFRGDRAIEISRAFEQEEFDAFDRGPRPKVFYAGMMQYDGDTQVPARFLVEPPVIERTMGELLVEAGRRQLAIAETQKYGHVTYFWNGNRSGYFDEHRERYVEVPSDIGGFDAKPWMKAQEVTDRLIEELERGIGGGPFDFVRVNYANGDMVGHTGNLEATIAAVEAVDACLARLVEETKARDGVLIVTADHGNADQMFDGAGETRRPRTSHSLNAVPFCIFDPREARGMKLQVRGDEGLASVTATALALLGLSAPEGYEPSLV